MSKLKVSGNASGTGVITLEAPNTNTDRAITLPDSAGTLLMTDGDGSNLTGLSHTPEGTAVVSTGETGATKFLREDGDGTCSWQAAGGGADTSLSNLTATGAEKTCKAWVNFGGGDGTTAGNVYDSINISSVTANATGKYTINFTTSFGNANYCGVLSSQDGWNYDDSAVAQQSNGDTITTSTFPMWTSLSGSSPTPDDARRVHAAFFGG